MTSTSTPSRADLTVRFAGAADAAALRDLAALDSALPLTGPVVVGLVDGALVAALAIGDGRSVADPFVRTDAVRAVLLAYAERATATAPARRVPWRRPVHAAA
jgi:hypothetical protein